MDRIMARAPSWHDGRKASRATGGMTPAGARYRRGTRKNKHGYIAMKTPALIGIVLATAWAGCTSAPEGIAFLPDASPTSTDLAADASHDARPLDEGGGGDTGARGATLATDASPVDGARDPRGDDAGVDAHDPVPRDAGVLDARGASDAAPSRTDARAPNVPGNPLPGDPVGVPALIQGRYGRAGNFELMVPSKQGGVLHYYRDNDDPTLSWRGPFRFAEGLGAIDAVTLLQSSASSPGALHVVLRAGESLYHLVRDEGPPFAWSTPTLVGVEASGTHVMIESSYGAPDNFELVAPSSRAGIDVYWRNNGVARPYWVGPDNIATLLGQVDSVSLIQSHIGSPGNLEMVARAGRSLAFMWRDSDPNKGFSSYDWIGHGAAGNPVLIQDKFGTGRDFELMVPSESGGLDHYRRDNSNPAFPWSGPTNVFPGYSIDGITFIQGNFGAAGNLEIVMRSGDRLLFAFREQGVFHGPFSLVAPP
jgi:hypothetical protein